MLRHERRVGGEAFHVGDSFVWTEIYYLDSTTDYREYLPHPSPVPTIDSELVMLDGCPEHSSCVNAHWVGATLLAAIMGIIFLLFVYFSQ